MVFGTSSEIAVLLAWGMKLRHCHSQTAVTSRSCKVRLPPFFDVNFGETFRQESRSDSIYILLFLFEF